MIAFFPDPITRLQIPRYLANGLFVLTGRTLMPVLSSSNTNRSPARIPSALRTARGTVIRPFDVIFACAFTLSVWNSFFIHSSLLGVKGLGYWLEFWPLSSSQLWERRSPDEITTPQPWLALPIQGLLLASMFGHKSTRGERSKCLRRRLPTTCRLVDE